MLLLVRLITAALVLLALATVLSNINSSNNTSIHHLVLANGVVVDPLLVKALVACPTPLIPVGFLLARASHPELQDLGTIMVAFPADPQGPKDLQVRQDSRVQWRRHSKTLNRPPSVRQLISQDQLGRPKVKKAQIRNP
jgi:hypothetical protein